MTEERRISEEEYLGKRVLVSIEDPWHPIHAEGIVERVDDMGQLHGTWGSLAAIPGIDTITIVKGGD